MKVEIKLWHKGNLKTSYVEADVIDELAIYPLNGTWTVGHVLSGAWIAAFTHKHVAVNFAKRVMSIYSLDYYYQVEDPEYRKEVSGAMNNWRKHVAFRDQQYVGDCPYIPLNGG